MTLRQQVVDYFGVGHDINTQGGRMFTMLGWSTWLAGRAAGLTTGLLKTLRSTYSHVQYLERILQEHEIPFDRFLIDREALWYDLDMDFDMGEVDGAIENSNAGVEETSEGLQSVSDSIAATLNDRLLNHLLQH